jgi:DNA-binding Xre family transcriptional regulator
MAKSNPRRKTFSSLEEYARGGRLSGRTLAQIRQLARDTEVIDRMVLERVRAGLTQTELARRLGTSQSYVSKLEDSADADLTLGEIDRYCAALGISAGLSLKV